MAGREFDVNRFYDALAASWDSTRPGYTAKIFERITSKLDKARSYHILDFGCGTGLLCKFLSGSLPNAKVDGIDVSNQMIERARDNCPNCAFYVGDILQTGLPMYDVIISKDVFNHVGDVRKVISRLDSILNPQGTIIIANRERETGIKNGIIFSLEALDYVVAVEHFSFAPSEEEISAFLRTLSDFKEEHKNRIRNSLESAGSYYMIFAEKTDR